MTPKLVLVESPFAPPNAEEKAHYLLAALRDSVARGEAPFASHLFYTQFLDDTIPNERALGIELGLLWGSKAELSAVYVDLGISKGMQLGIERAEREGRPIVYRNLTNW